MTPRARVILMCSTMLLLAATSGGPTLSGGGSSGGTHATDNEYGFDVVQEEPRAHGEVTTTGGGGEPAPEPHAVFSFPVLDTDQTTGNTIDLGEPPRIAAQRIADTLAPAAPFVQPDNRAITGIWSYLTTNIDSDFSDTVTVTLFGQDWLVDVDVIGEHTIDWGDGTVTTATGDGGPWHEGEPGPDDIAHGYIDAGDHTLVVTTDWTVTATLRATGTTAVQALSTTSDPVTIDVDEVRSVRDS